MDRLSDQVINEMTPEERLELIERLWDSLDDAGAELSPEQAAELDRRLDHLESDIANGISWEQLKADLVRRHG